MSRIKTDEENPEWTAKDFARSSKHADLLPNLPSLIRRVCSGYAPMWGVLRTPSV